jgi:5-methylcytosine-specific restriction endonuclease McrA
MKVFVLSKERKPLMPTTPRRARLWLKAKRARVVSREPFTIQLKFETTQYTQSVKVGVDTGSHVVGIAAIANGEAVYQAEVHLRTDVSLKLTRRRQYRRNRRSRKTRYRPARFANRRRKSGWLAPSLCSKADATVKAVCFVASILPIGRVNVEVASFDTQKMQNPEIQGEEYQQGQLQGYLLREYLLAKWGRKCVYCQAQGIPLQIEHLTPRSRGGSNRASNLAMACEPCNTRKGTQTASEFGYPEIQAQAKTPLRDAAHVSSLKTAVLTQLRAHFGTERIAITYGYETKYKRIQMLALPKSHANDAVAIACEMGEIVKAESSVYQIRCIARGSYQLSNGKRSEHKVWAPKKLHGWKLYELVEAKGQLGYIGGRRVKGAFVVKDVVSGKTLSEVTPRKLRRFSRPVHGWIITRFPFSRITGMEGGASSPG